MLLFGPGRSECPRNNPRTFVSQWQGKIEPPVLNGQTENAILLSKTPLSVQNVSVPKQREARFNNKLAGRYIP